MLRIARLGSAALVLMASACQPSVRTVRAAVASASTWPFTVAPFPENRVQAYLHVDPSNPAASDSNSGLENQPLRTISKAVRTAQQSKSRGIGVKVVIHPGIYREQITIPVRSQETDAPLVIEGTDKGAVILSGADVWDGWQRQGADNVYIHPWPYKWGEAAYPPGWEGNVVLQPAVRRREMVFVNGTPLRQIVAPADLIDNSFVVSEADQRITMRLAPGLPIEQAMVEVATRSPILSAQGQTNLVLRKLLFRYGNPALPDAAVQITDSTGVLVEDCDFAWSNWDGLDVLVSKDVTLRTTTANNNGGSGFGGYKLERFLMEDTDASFNNWRGAMGQFFGWAVAGAKFGAIHDGLIRRHRAASNQTRGFWLDYDNVNVSLEQCGLYSNKTDGIFIEANAGPVAIRNSAMVSNVEGSGVLGSNSSDVTISDSVLASNGRAQIEITGVDTRSVLNWKTGVTANVRAERWSLLSNLIWVDTGPKLWLQTPEWPWFMTGLTSRRNLWSRPLDPRAFQVGSKRLALYDWQQVTAADLDSVVYIR